MPAKPKLKKRAVTIWLDQDKAEGLGRVAASEGLDVQSYLSNLVRQIADEGPDRAPLLVFLSREDYQDFHKYTEDLLAGETEEDRRALIADGLIDPENPEPDLDQQMRLQAADFVRFAVDRARERGHL